jgi:hypothetical protein
LRFVSLAFLVSSVILFGAASSAYGELRRLIERNPWDDIGKINPLFRNISRYQELFPDGKLHERVILLSVLAVCFFFAAFWSWTLVSNWH